MSRAGRKAFNRCDVKVVEFKDYVLDGPKPLEDEEDNRSIVRSENPSDDPRDLVGTAAILHCPLTEDDRVTVESQYMSHESRIEALNSVRGLAGELLCRNCKYSSMSAIEVSQERAALARTEAERLEAITARRQALNELQSADPDFRLHE